MEAIATLQRLSTQRGADFVVREDPYPLVEVLAAAAVFPIGLAGATAKSGNVVGGLILAAILFVFIMCIEVIVELRHRSPTSTLGVGR